MKSNGSEECESFLRSGPAEAHQGWDSHGLGYQRLCSGWNCIRRQYGKNSGPIFDGQKTAYIASCYIEYPVVVSLLPMQVEIEHKVMIKSSATHNSYYNVDRKLC